MMEYSSTVLVTGAFGFIGRALVNAVLEQQAKVRTLTRGHIDLPDHWVQRTEIRVGDLVNPGSIAHVADGIETVYHLAGEIRDPRLYDKVNREGTERLLEGCQAAGVRRFLYLSSVGVIGAAGAAKRIDETTVAFPRGPYEFSKYAGEQAALRAHRDSGMQVTVVRPSIVYGEGKLATADSFLSWARAVGSGRFVLLGHDYVSNYVYVGDVVAACLYLASHPMTGGKVYIMNEPIPLTVFVSELARLLAVRNPSILPIPLGALAAVLLRLSRRFRSLYNRTIYSTDKLSALGFALPYGHREGLRRTINWYQGRSLLPFRSPRS